MCLLLKPSDHNPNLQTDGLSLVPGRTLFSGEGEGKELQGCLFAWEGGQYGNRRVLLESWRRGDGVLERFLALTSMEMTIKKKKKSCFC